MPGEEHRLFHSMSTEEFYVTVKKLEGDEWVATLGEQSFRAASEAEVREAVRLHLLESVARSTGKPIESLQARLKRTWRVRVVEKAEPKADDDDDMPVFDLFG
jgi:hypothetical protein